jgi:hypothetical protein
MAVDFRFRGLLNTSQPVDLIFGAEESGGTENTISFDITLAPPSVDVLLSSKTLHRVSFNIALAAPTADFDLAYDLAVSHGPQSRTTTNWQTGAPRQAIKSSSYEQGTKLRPERAAPWGSGTHYSPERSSRWQENARAPHQRSARWQQGTLNATAPTRSAWQEASRAARLARAAAWEEATHRAGRAAASPWQELTRTSRPTKVMPWGEGSGLTKSWRSDFEKTIHVEVFRRAPWEEARKPPPGKIIVQPPVIPPDDPCYIPPAANAVHLLFDERADGSTSLLFYCDRHPVDPEHPALIIVPIKRVYMVINETSLRRVDGNVPIPTIQASLTLDVDSWTWSFSATLPGRALADVEPDTDGVPVELEANINGVFYRVLCESISRDRTFNSSSIRIQGRGKAASLDKPYSPILNFGNTEDRTAQQLANDALLDNGVPIGWAVDWQLDDWLVPAGLWSIQGSRIDALNQIAGAAGGYLQPTKASQVIRVLPRYPVAPWSWQADVAPDFQLPADVTTRESITWTEKARYNRVFVSGTAGGILCQVTRAGTAGDVVAPMVTDGLIVQPAAGRQRGLSILADTGRQANVSLRLPVLPETGVIEPGKFVRYVDGGVTRLGIVRSTGVEFGSPSVFQTIGIETHVFS